MIKQWIRVNVTGVRIAAAALALTATPCLAAGYGTAGCGLGSLIFGSKQGFVQVFAATTNNTLATQTFGITSGTSNCGSGGGGGGGRIDADLRIQDFITANLATLNVDSARGRGDSLTALASLYGCDVSQDTLRAFDDATQKEHSRIFAQPEPQAVHAQLHSTLHANDQLSQRCVYAS